MYVCFFKIRTLHKHGINQLETYRLFEYFITTLDVYKRHNSYFLRNMWSKTVKMFHKDYQPRQISAWHHFTRLWRFTFLNVLKHFINIKSITFLRPLKKSNPLYSEYLKFIQTVFQIQTYSEVYFLFKH